MRCRSRRLPVLAVAQPERQVVGYVTEAYALEALFRRNWSACAAPNWASSDLFSIGPLPNSKTPAS